MLRRITASKYAHVIKCKKPEGHIKRILYPSQKATSDALRYGRENEDNAVAAYKVLKGLHDCDITVTETGLHVGREFSFLGASPDRIVRDGNDEGLLEVKCPYSKQDMSPAEACTDKRFFCELVNTEVVLRKDNTYYYQIQGQMAITGHKWCDFVVWTNNGSPALSTNVERVRFDESFWETKVLPGLLYFARHALVPELLCKRLKRLGKLYLNCDYVPYIKHERRRSTKINEN